MLKQFCKISFLSALLLSSGCSPSSLITTEGLAGSLLGAAGGSGVGYAIGQQIGKTKENMLLAGGIGAGLGIMGGALLHEHNISAVQKRQIVIRQAQVINRQQQEIDSLRDTMHDNSAWGRGEVRPWNERYLGENSDSPYEGYSR